MEPVVGALAGLPLPAILVNRSEHIVHSNAKATALLGMEPNGHHFATILRQPQVIAAIEICMATGLPQEARFLASGQSLDLFYQLSCSRISIDGSVEADLVMACFVDMGQKEQISQIRRDFVANVSHELRTPLTALLAFIETLRGSAQHDSRAQERFLGIMQAEAERMSRLIDDLLSLNKVESEENIQPTGKVILNELLSDVTNLMRPLMQEADIRLALSLPEARVHILGESDQLRQVFTNLLENVLKYAASGREVTVELFTTGHDATSRGPAAEVRTTDKGPGIDPIHLPRLTERFYRVDAHRSREVGGTGLGLAIVKHIVNRHRGYLRVDSIPGQGSTFSVILPRMP